MTTADAQDVPQKSRRPRKSVKRTFVNGEETTYRTLRDARKQTGLTVARIEKLAGTGEYDADGSRYEFVTFTRAPRGARPLIATHVSPELLEKAKVRAGERSVSAYLRDLVEADVAAAN